MRSSPERVLIVGATSAIAESTARIWAERGCALHLVGRARERLSAIAADLRVRGASRVSADVLDVNDFGRHEEVLRRCVEQLGGLDVVLIAHGTLANQLACEESVELTMSEITTNALSVIALATRIAALLCAQKSGTLAVISSVAGDRGRSSNYVYGSSKAMVSTFLSGLRQRVIRDGVCVVTIKPGFVDTPMTEAFAKGFLWAKPASVGTAIVRAIDRRSSVVYIPFFWRPIMLAVKMIPERLFSRLTL